MPRPNFNPATDIVLGQPLPPSREKLFFLPPADQQHHAMIWGRTGSGKSRFLQSLFLQHVTKHGQIGLLDPHGDLALDSLAFLCERGFFDAPDAFERLIYLDFSEDWVVPLNVLALHRRPKTAALTALEAMIRVWPELRRAPSFQTLFLSAITVCRLNDLPLTALAQVLTDREMREQCLARVTDPLLLQAFERYEHTNRTQESASAFRRAFLLCFDDLTRLALGQPDCVLDLRRLMDEGRSLIVNLGSIAESETRRLVGALLMVQIEQAALSRKDLPPGERRPWTVLVDEWPAVAASDEAIGTLLEQTRKYGLRLYLAAQSMGQVSSTRLEAALENCKLTVAFGLGRSTAREQARELSPLSQEEDDSFLSFLFPPPPAPSAHQQQEQLMQDLRLLGPQDAYVRRHNDPAVKLRTLFVPDAHPVGHRLGEVLATYRQRYQRPVEVAELQAQQLLGRFAPAPADEPFNFFAGAGRSADT
jgi:hypothetical protein